MHNVSYPTILTLTRGHNSTPRCPKPAGDAQCTGLRNAKFPIFAKYLSSVSSFTCLFSFGESITANQRALLLCVIQPNDYSPENDHHQHIGHMPMSGDVGTYICHRMSILSKLFFTFCLVGRSAFRSETVLTDCRMYFETFPNKSDKSVLSAWACSEHCLGRDVSVADENIKHRWCIFLLMVEAFHHTSPGYDFPLIDGM